MEDCESCKEDNNVEALSDMSENVLRTVLINIYAVILPPMSTPHIENLSEIYFYQLSLPDANSCFAFTDGSGTNVKYQADSIKVRSSLTHSEPRSDIKVVTCDSEKTKPNLKVSNIHSGTFFNIPSVTQLNPGKRF